MAQWLRALAGPEDWGSVPRMYMASQTSLQFQFQGSDTVTDIRFSDFQCSCKHAALNFNKLDIMVALM